MRWPKEKARKLMEIKLASNFHVRNHCELVTEKALEIGKKLKQKGYDIDLDLLETSALVHDIGRSITHDLWHFIESAKILREAGFPERVIQTVERHILGGISAEEAEKLGLPKKDYIPITLEEKVLCYADKFVETKFLFKEINNEEIIERKSIKHDSIESTLNRFRKRFGNNNPSIVRLEKLRDEIELMLTK